MSVPVENHFTCERIGMQQTLKEWVDQREKLETKVHALNVNKCFLEVKEILHPFVKLKILDEEVAFKGSMRGSYVFRRDPEGGISHG